MAHNIWQRARSHLRRPSKPLPLVHTPIGLHHRRRSSRSRPTNFDRRVSAPGRQPPRTGRRRLRPSTRRGVIRSRCNTILLVLFNGINIRRQVPTTETAIPRQQRRRARQDRTSPARSCMHRTFPRHHRLRPQARRIPTFTGLSRRSRLRRLLPLTVSTRNMACRLYKAVPSRHLILSYQRMRNSDSLPNRLLPGVQYRCRRARRSRWATASRQARTSNAYQHQASIPCRRHRRPLPRLLHCPGIQPPRAYTKPTARLQSQAHSPSHRATETAA